MPKEIEKLKDKNYLEQICGQILYLEKNIENDIEEVGRERLKIVQYDKLCDFPKRELDEISCFLDSHGCNLKFKHNVPKNFNKVEYGKRILSEEEIIICNILRRYKKEGIIQT